MEQHKPNIILLSETHITEEINDCELEVSGYDIVRCNSDSRHTGGVIVYIKSHISYTVISNINIERNWFLAVKITKGYEPGIFGLVYHSPNGNVGLFLKSFEEWCDNVIDMTKTNTIIGDFNINWSGNHANREKLLNLCNYLNIHQKVKSFTRITKSSKTLIDLVFSNNKNIKVQVLDNLKISDHQTLHIIDERLKNKFVFSETVEIKDWSRYSKSEANKLCAKQNFECISGFDLNLKTEMFSEKLNQVLDQLVSTKKVNTHFSNKWFSMDIKNLQVVRDLCYKIARSTNTDVAWQDYSKSRNQYTNALKKSKSEYIQQEIENTKHDNKKMWKILKGLLQQKYKTKNSLIFQNIILLMKLKKLLKNLISISLIVLKKLRIVFQI